MQTSTQKLYREKNLICSIIGISAIMFLANYFGQESIELIGNLIFVPITGILVALSIFFAIRNGTTGTHGKAWILFFLSVTSWFIGEQIWLVYDLVYDKDPFPSEADFFYLIGYIFYFGFAMYYLKPVKNAISKKMIAVAIASSTFLTMPAAYIYFESISDTPLFEKVLAASYPVADAIVLVPAIIGLALFVGGKVNFTWSLMMIAMLVFVAADTGFLAATLDNSYYTGHPVDTIYLWTYILFSFGIYDHIKLFKKRGEKNLFNDQESLR